MHPYEDSDSSEDEVDWQDTRDDPYIPGIDAFIFGDEGGGRVGWAHRKAKVSNESLYFIFVFELRLGIYVKFRYLFRQF